MDVSPFGLLPLAAEGGVDSIMNEMSSGFRGRQVQLESVAVLKILGISVAVILLIVLLVQLGNRWRREARSTPGWLFWRLCAAHQLRWRDRWLLWSVARQVARHEPAEVFVNRECLENAIALGWPSDSRVRALQQRLFEPPRGKGPAENQVIEGPAPLTSPPVRIRDGLLPPAALWPGSPTLQNDSPVQA